MKISLATLSSLYFGFLSRRLMLKQSITPPNVVVCTTTLILSKSRVSVARS